MYNEVEEVNNKLIIVSAVWCPSCLVLKKNLKKIEEEYKINYELLDYDFDEDRVKELNVGDKLPVIICNDKRIIGEKSYDEILTFLKDSGII